jgi:serine protease Do
LIKCLKIHGNQVFRYNSGLIKGWKRIFSIVTVVVAVATHLSAAPRPREDAANTAGVATRTGTASLLRELNGNMEALVDRVSPAVVQISVSGYGLMKSKDQKGVSLVGRQTSIGSGIIAEPDGYIMTNAHVIEGAEQIRVTLPPPISDSVFRMQAPRASQTLEAKVIGSDRESDLALIKVEASNLPTVPLNESHPVHQGQLVFAIGSPEGMQDSVSMGVVSAPLRQPDPDSPMVYIQTDAPINPGNSGGPLVDIDGSLVGINTLILTQGGGSEGLGFAVPAGFVRFVYDNLRKYGRVRRAEIGVGLQEITPDLAAGLGLGQNWGVIVADVSPAGTSAAAGLRVGDIVVSVDRHPIFGLPGCSEALYLHPLNQPVSMEVLRGGRTLSLALPVHEHREHLDQLTDVASLQNNLLAQFGVFAVNLDRRVQALLNGVRSESGVVVVAQAASAPASVQTGLQPGDIIYAMNRRSIQSLDQLRQALKPMKAGDPVVLQIERDGSLQYIAFELEG